MHSVPAWLSRARLDTDVGLAVLVVLLVVMLVVPLPSVVMDLANAVSITLGVMTLMTALFMRRPLDFTSFPQLLLLVTVLRLALNVATTRAILTSGHEGPTAAGSVISAFGGFLMGGDLVVGMIIFAIVMIVNYVVIGNGSTRIAEVSARFGLDSLPGKQMAIDADLSSGLIDEAEARRRRKDLEEEMSFIGAMDGAAKYVRGDNLASVICTVINLLGGIGIGTLRHGMQIGEATATFSLLTVGDGLTGLIPALLTSVAAGIVVTKSGAEGTADRLMIGQLGAGWKPLAIASGTSLAMGLLPGMPLLLFTALAGATGAAAWHRHRTEAAEAAAVASGVAAPAAAPTEPPIAETLRMDLLRLELGYGLLSLAAGDAPRLTEQIRGLRRSIAQEMGFVLPSVRIQDNLQLPPDAYVIRVKEIEAGRGQLRPPMLLAIDPNGGVPDMPGEGCTEPSFGLPALWIEEARRDEALARGCTVVDAAGVVATHLTEVVRENMAELLSFAETQKLLDELPREQQKLVQDLVPTQITTGGIQRVLQSLLAERVSIRDLPTILEGVQEATAAGARTMPAIVATVRARLARQISDAARGPQGYVPLIALSAQWETAFAEALTGPAEDRQLAMAPARLAEFMQRLREAFDAAAATGENPVLVCSAPLRAHLRAIVERFRPATTVLAQTEIHPRARIRTVGSL